ncbi:hypothetical protein PanWU01x14_154510 [Parasponia andersonii]|uniref:Uncharacterized protein n=1 Tax=Parasponia andersonii TaxID=3476 RepID=A0A2P5CGE9_PARAD|nr:hypothetical protein PanWU01x14_154510 [Parasponia andersonii]
MNDVERAVEMKLLNNHVRDRDQPGDLEQVAEQHDYIRGHVQLDKQQDREESYSLSLRVREIDNSRVYEIEGSEVRDQRDIPDVIKATRLQALGSVFKRVGLAARDIDQERGRDLCDHLNQQRVRTLGTMTSRNSTTSVSINDQFAQEVAYMRNELNCLAAHEEY